MNDFIGRNIKFIAEWGQLTMVICILIFLGLAFILVRKNKFFLPKGILHSFGFTFLIILTLFSSLILARITQIRPNVLPILQQMDELVGQQAPNLIYQRISDNQTTSLSNDQGKVILVNYWATWCKPCLKEIPDLVKLEEKYKSQDFKVLMISDEEIGHLQMFAQQKKMSIEIGTTPTFDWASLGNERPASFLINRSGEVSAYVTGSRDFDFFEKHILELL